MLTALIGGIIFVTVSTACSSSSRIWPASRSRTPCCLRSRLYVGGTLFQSVVLVCTTVAVLASGMAAHAGCRASST